MASSISWQRLILLLFLLASTPEASSATPGITEQTGKRAALEARFVDDTGGELALGSLVDRPVILGFAYYGCRDVCSTLLSNLASSVGRVNSVPGEDFRLITVSMDERDSTDAASRKRTDYTKAAGREMPEGAWRFLTGDAASIDTLASSVGFGFRRDADGFDHPAALAVLSPDGRIVRYLYGGRFLPADIDMAIAEAREGRVTASIKKAMLLCYRVRPDGGYALDILRLAGLATLLFSAALFIYLTIGKGKAGRR